MRDREDNMQGGNSHLRNGIILNLDKRMDEVLHGIGKIQGDVEALRSEGDKRTRELRKIERKLAKAVNKTNERLDTHLCDHVKNEEIMGAVPYLRKYVKRHWRIILALAVLSQLIFALFILRFGVEKLLNVIFGF